MKILIMGDLHATDKQPVNRADNYWQTLQDKVKWIVNLYNEEGCCLLLQPGDFFDSHRVPNVVIKTMIFLFRDIRVACVYGQHDMRYHNPDKSNTPLAVLEAAGTVEIMGKEPTPYINSTGRVVPFILGAGWGEDIPTELSDLGINILVTHRMVIKEKLWEGQEDFTHVQDMFKYGYDLMVTGDNHQRFSYSNGDQHLINCGSLMRSNIGQVDHEPFVYIYDTETKKVKGYQLPIDLSENVFNMDNAMKEKKRKEINDLFVKSLKNKTKIEGLHFSENVVKIVEHTKPNERVKNLVQEALNG